MSSLEDITAAILVGGLGTRLRSVVSDKPKVLASVNGRPFLSYLFDQIRHAGLKKVVLCTGYMSERVESEFGSRYQSLEITYSQEAAPLGTAGALRWALPHLASETIMVLNGDSFCHVDFVAFFQHHESHSAIGSLLLTQVADTARYGRVEIDSQNQILSFVEKGETGGPGLINAGIYLLQQPLIQTIPTGRAISLEREIFPLWLNQNLYGYPSLGPFLDIGTPESYQQAEQFFTSNIY